MNQEQQLKAPIRRATPAPDPDSELQSDLFAPLSELSEDSILQSCDNKKAFHNGLWHCTKCSVILGTRSRRRHWLKYHNPNYPKNTSIDHCFEKCDGAKCRKNTANSLVQYSKNERPDDTLEYDNTPTLRARLEAKQSMVDRQPYQTTSYFSTPQPRPTMSDTGMLAGLIGSTFGNAIQTIRNDPTHDIQALVNETMMAQNMWNMFGPLRQHAKQKHEENIKKNNILLEQQTEQVKRQKEMFDAIIEEKELEFEQYKEQTRVSQAMLKMQNELSMYKQNFIDKRNDIAKAYEKKALALKFKDADTWQEVVTRCSDAISIAAIQKMKVAELVSTCCAGSAYKYSLNNTQLGLSLLLALGYQRNIKRQLLLLPSGLGKSRVIFGVIAALLMVQNRKVCDVKVVYNHDSQMQDEASKLQQLSHDTGIPISPLSCLKSIQSAPGRLVILDEADAQILDRHVKLQGSQSHVIGLSATGIDEMEEFERAHFENLDFKTINSKIATDYCFDERPIVSNMDQFFSEKYDGTVRMIYVDVSREQELKERAKAKGYLDSDILVNLDNMTQLRQLQSTQFLLVTRAENMRGLDYRSEKPITLFLAKLCDSKRSLTQAYGRVGRYTTDRCHRLVDEALQVLPLQAIDPEEVAKRQASLLKAVVNDNFCRVQPIPVKQTPVRTKPKETPRANRILDALKKLGKK